MVSQSSFAPTPLRHFGQPNPFSEETLLRKTVFHAGKYSVYLPPFIDGAVLARSTAALILIILPLAHCEPLASQPTLDKADHYSDLFNWIDSARYYQEAEKRLPKGSAPQWRAHLGYLRATMETRPLPALSNYLGSLLQNPLFISDPRLRLWCLGIKGDVDGEMDSSSGRADWEEALAVAKRLKDSKWQSRSLAEIGIEAYLQGDISTGRRNIAGAVISAHKSGDLSAEIRYLSAIGTGLAWNHSYEEANNYLERALTLAKQCPDCGYPYNAIAGRIEVYLGQHKFDDADRWISDSMEHSRARQKNIKLTQAMLFSADSAFGKGQRLKAIQILIDTIRLAKHNQTRMLGDAEMKLAEIYLDQHNLVQSEHYADAAFSHTRLTNDLYAAPARLEFIAHLQWELGRRQDAQRRIDRALDIIEGFLTHTTSQRAKEGLLTAMSSAYETGFTFAAESNQVQRAYETIERVRGRITGEMLETTPNNAAPTREDISLEDNIRNLKLALLKAGSERERDRLVDRLFYEEQKRYVVDSAMSSHVKYAIVPIGQLARSLSADEAIIEYFLPEKGTAYCLLLTRSTGNIINLGDAKTLAGKVSTYVQEMGAFHWSRETAYSLFKMLVAPLPALDQYRRLTLVPDGVLNLLPFDTLITPSGNLLLKDFILEYAPSAVTSQILRTRKTDINDGQNFLGVGGVIYNQAATERFVLAKSTGRGSLAGFDVSKLPNLPGSRDEVVNAAIMIFAQLRKGELARNTSEEQLRKMNDQQLMAYGPNLNAVFQVGSSATEYAFTHAPLSNFQVIHLAVHALASESDPSRSAIIFPPDPERGEDGLLEPRGILSLRFRAKVVVLSACQTAIGRLQGQVGSANVARAFLQAGADSTISTLWSVDNEYSVALMRNFYRHFATGEDVASSLTMAKRDMLVQYGSKIKPTDWAGFIVFGNGHASLATQPNQSAYSQHSRN